MYNRRRSAEIVQKAQARRAREDAARRLRDEVPDLDSLSLNIQQYRAEGGAPESDHIRRVVVEHAPALFFIPCSEKTCQDGGHDVTVEVLRALRSGQTRFEGEHECSGRVGSSNCNRRLRFVGTATYQAARVSEGAVRLGADRPPIGVGALALTPRRGEARPRFLSPPP